MSCTRRKPKPNGGLSGRRSAKSSIKHPQTLFKGGAAPTALSARLCLAGNSSARQSLERANMRVCEERRSKGSARFFQHRLGFAVQDLEGYPAVPRDRRLAEYV